MFIRDSLSSWSFAFWSAKCQVVVSVALLFKDDGKSVRRNAAAVFRLLVGSSSSVITKWWTLMM